MTFRFANNTVNRFFNKKIAEFLVGLSSDLLTFRSVKVCLNRYNYLSVIRMPPKRKIAKEEKLKEAEDPVEARERPKRLRQKREVELEPEKEEAKPKAAKKVEKNVKKTEKIKTTTAKDEEVEKKKSDTKTKKGKAAAVSDDEAEIAESAKKISDKKTRRGKAAAIRYYEDEEDEIVEPAKEKSDKKTKRGKAAAVSDDEDEEDEIAEPTKKTSDKKTKRGKPAAVSDDEDEIAEPTKKTSDKKTKRGKPAAVSDDEDEIAEPTKKTSDKKTKRGKAAAVSDDEDEDEIAEPAKKKRIPTKKLVVAEKDDKKTKKNKAKTAKDEDDTPVPEKKGRKMKIDEPADSKNEKVSNTTETNWDEIDFSCDKKNANGDLFNIKITCWNIGGIKAWVKKGGLEILKYCDPDILCLQETKCSEDMLPEEVKNYEGYHMYWKDSQKAGYAGVGLLSKIEPLDVQYGLGHPEHDDEGRCITAEYDQFYVVCVYVPNAGRKLVTLPKRLKWNEVFNDYIKKLDEKKPVIICGDMNVAHQEIDLANPKTNTKNAGFTVEERDGFTDFLSTGFVDMFREFYPDKDKVYTFWTYMSNSRKKNVGWRLDYFVLSKRSIGKVCDITTNTDVFGSDHCPLTMFVKF